MANPLLLFPNRIDDGALSGGAWDVDHPLANIQNRRLLIAARSSDLLKASTRLLLTLDQPQRIKLLALINCNLDPTARIRVRAGTDLRTNYLLYSEQLDNAAWVKTAASVTANQALAADGLQTLDRLIENTANAAHYVNQVVALAPSATRYVSGEARANGRTRIRVYLQDWDVGTNFVYGTFDLVGAGSVAGGVGHGGNGTLESASIEDLGGGNYRWSLQGKPNTSGTNTAVSIRVHNGAGLETYTGDGASGIYLGKVDLGTAPGAYVATTSAAAQGPDLRLYDSAWRDAYDTVYPADAVEWEDDPFFTGKPTTEDWQNLVQYAIHILPTAVAATHWLIEIDDAANDDGYVQIGRVFLSGQWEIARAAEPGAVIGVIHPTIVDAAISGAESYDAIGSRRSFGFRFNTVGREDGFTRALDMMRRAGVHRELFFVLDPDQTTHLLRTSALVRQEAVSKVDLPMTGNNVTPEFALVEIVG